MVAWNNMSWGYWQYQPVPVVSKYKWLEPRHMVNVCERWAKDRTDGLQAAFFNGVGYESWENVWGIWNQLTPRDAEALRRIAMIERALAELLFSPDWQPHFPTLQRGGRLCQPLPGAGRTLWLLVNRGGKDVERPATSVPADRCRVSTICGTASSCRRASPANGHAELSRSTHAASGRSWPSSGRCSAGEWSTCCRGCGASGEDPPGRPFGRVEVLPQKIVESRGPRRPREPPDGMVLIPGGQFRFQVSGVEIEGGDGPGVDVQYPWEDLPRRHHDKQMDIHAFYIDKYPVTNAQFKRFLDASGYQAQGRPQLPQGLDRRDVSGRAGTSKPVTWVSLEDARAYAAWAGKRLPHEWEWQYAAQGGDGRLYPWGKNPTRPRVPKPESGRELRPPTDVDAYPKGASPFGVMDLVGNVWQWTDEYLDEHTRAAVLRGGSYYRPSGSGWYFPQNTRLDQHGEVSADGPVERPLGTAWLPLRRGCGRRPDQVKHLKQRGAAGRGELSHPGRCTAQGDHRPVDGRRPVDQYRAGASSISSSAAHRHEPGGERTSPSMCTSGW